MKRLILAVLLLPTLATAQVWRPVLRPTLTSVPLTTANAPLIPEPAGTIAHLWVPTSGAVARDTKANAWTATSPRTTNISTSALGPWAKGVAMNSASYPRLGSGSDALDVANFETCAVFVPVGTGAAQYWLGNGAIGSAGYHGGVAIGGACTANFSAVTITTTNTVRPGALNVCCIGRSGTTGYVMLNGGATATATVVTTSDTIRIAAAGCANAGATCVNHLYELIFVGAAYSDAWARSVVSTVMPHRTR